MSGGQAGRELERWLEALELQDWFAPLLQEDVRVGDLPHLTEDDLKNLGMPLGPRRRLMAAAERSAASAVPPIDGLSGAERRVLTVAFFDLVGSTELSDRLDTETLREVIARYQELVTELVTRQGGHVAKYLGDGTLAYFGWPAASTDQAVAALRAAKQVVGELPSIDIRGIEVDLQGRVGIATGEVILGDIAGEKDAIVGRTANLAARLEGQAPPGGVAIEARTASLTGQRFELTSGGAAELKGLEQPVEVLIVGDEQTDHVRFSDSASRSANDVLVGRDEERATVIGWWANAAVGDGLSGAVSGEAGVGKSRLLHELVRGVSDSDRVVTLQCAPESSATPMRPVVQWLESVSGAQATLDSTLRGEMVAAHLGDVGLDADDVEFFFRLLPRQQLPSITNAEATAGYEQLLSSLVRLMLGSAEQPTLLILEDAHWVDPTTLELFRRIAKRTSGSHTLAVVTHRTDWTPPKSLSRNLETIELGALDNASVAALALSTDSTASDVVDEVVEKSGGNPFYAREYTAFLTRRRDTGESEVPFTLATSLLGQLDALGAAKRIAQVASALGQSFESDLLGAMIGTDSAEAQELLDPLVDRGMVVPGDVAGAFKFVHALVRDAAYDSLLAADRQILHGRAADAASASGRVPPQVLALHCRRAGRSAEAMLAWRRAGEQALTAGAAAEVVEAFTEALEVLDECPEELQRGGAERLEILLQLATATMVVRGYASESARVLYREAADIAEQLGDSASHFVAIWGGYYTTEVRADFHQSGSDIEELLSLDVDALPRDLSIQIDHAAATYFGAYGPIDVAAHHSRRMVDGYDEQAHCEHRHLFGAHDPGVCGHGQLAQYEMLLARPESALEHSRRAVALGERLGHAPSTAIGLMFAALVGMTGRLEDRRERVDRAVDFCGRHGVSAVGLTVDLFRSALIDDPEQRHAALLKRLTPMRAGEFVGLFVPTFAGLTAEAALAVGAVDDAVAMLDYADLVIDRSAQRTSTPTILHQRALVAAALGDDEDQVDARFAEAYASAEAFSCPLEQLLIVQEWVPRLRKRGHDEKAADLLADLADLLATETTHHVFRAVRSLVDA